MMCYFNEPGCALCANAPCPVYHALCTTCCAQYTMCYAATLHTACSVHHVPCTNALCTYATCTITVLCVSVHRAPMHRASSSVHPCTVQCAKCTVTLHSVHQSTTLCTCSLRWHMYAAPCTAAVSQCTVHSTLCIRTCTVQCTLCTKAPCSAQCTNTLCTNALCTKAPCTGLRAPIHHALCSVPCTNTATPPDPPHCACAL